MAIPRETLLRVMNLLAQRQLLTPPMFPVMPTGRCFAPEFGPGLAETSLPAYHAYSGRGIRIEPGLVSAGPLVARHTYSDRAFDPERLSWRMSTESGWSVGIGDRTCANNAHSPHLRCVINPCGPCEGCSDYAPSQQ
jgi:hypothetical protein